MDFEKKLKELETIVEQLGSGELSLADSEKFFHKGVKLSDDCMKQLNKSEETVKKLTSINDNGEIQTKDFKSFEKDSVK